MKQVIIINQALSLRDVVNGDDDPIDDAREEKIWITDYSRENG